MLDKEKTLWIKIKEKNKNTKSIFKKKKRAKKTKKIMKTRWKYKKKSENLEKQLKESKKERDKQIEKLNNKIKNLKKQLNKPLIRIKGIIYGNKEASLLLFGDKWKNIKIIKNNEEFLEQTRMAKTYHKKYKEVFFDVRKTEKIE